MAFGIPSFQGALRKLGIAGGAPEESEAAGAPKDSAEPGPTQVSEEDLNPWDKSPASEDSGMPLPDDETAKTASAGAKGFKESWGGAYKNFMAGGGSKTEEPSQGAATPSGSPPPFEAGGGSKTEEPSQDAATPSGSPPPFEAGGGSKTEAPSRSKASPSAPPSSGEAQEIPVEDLSIGVFNALSDGFDAVIKMAFSTGSFVTTETRNRIQEIRSETASEFRVLRKYVAQLICGTGDEKSKEN